ncbi:MAG: hypothetical protein ACYC5J_20100 [Chloroflexota bacterium]
MDEPARQRRPGGDAAPNEYPVDTATRKIFQRALLALNKARLPYAVGGAFALHWYSGFWRVAKDLDIFLLPEHTGWAMRLLDAVGFNTRVKHEQWLAEALRDHQKVDLIYGMGNWLDYVDRGYLDRAEDGVVLGVPAPIMPAEELIYSKAFVASRERYDWADVFHTLAATGEGLDWDRVVGLFGDNWEVLLSLLVLFRYVYPSHREVIPARVLDALLARFEQTRAEPWTGGKLCRGFLLDGIGTYSLDVKEWGYRDARQEAWEKREMRRHERRGKAA